MEFLSEFLPIILYVLLAILVVVMIVLGIRLIKTLDKVDRVVDGVNDKLLQLNGLFDIIDGTADALAHVSDVIVGFLSSGIMKLFHRKKGKRE